MASLDVGSSVSPYSSGDLVQSASDSIQAHERLFHQIKSKLKARPEAQDALSDCSSVLEELRAVKSRLEGTYFKYRPLSLDNERLATLKYTVTSHTPSTLYERQKAKMAEAVLELLGGQVKRVLYACVLTCPWCASAECEQSAKAKTTLLYVVYVGTDEQFFSLATPHERELAETIDQGVVFAADVRHFMSQVLKGNVRAVEALCVPPESVVMSTPTWYWMVGQLDPVKLCGKSFVDRCLGQAVGALVKKKKVHGKLVLRDDITPLKFCDSFRLLDYVECVKERRPVVVWRSDVLSTCSSPSAREALELLTQAFEGVFNREGLLKCLLSWKERLGEVETVAHSDLWTPELGRWLSEVRLDGVKLSPPIEPEHEDKARLKALLTEIGMSHIPASDVLAVCEAGSRLYDLALPTSDTDYIVIYRHSTQQLISSPKSIQESHDNRGQKLATEAGAYEARMFCDMLLKGAVNIVEMVFAGDSLYYSSQLWRDLTRHKDKFLSEEVVYQYLGYIKTHTKLLPKHAGTPRERKLFYSIFHKLLSLERFVECGPPVVRCSGEEREFIMSIRRGPLEGPISAANLKLMAETKLAGIGNMLRSRGKRMREFGDYSILQSWLLNVRGVELKSELTMGCKPLADLTYSIHV